MWKLHSSNSGNPLSGSWEDTQVLCDLKSWKVGQLSKYLEINLYIDAKKNKCDFETRHVILIALFLTFLSTTIIATFLSIFPSS